MTCVAGIVERGGVYLGGDSIAVGGYAMEVRAMPKVFRHGPFVIGCAGSFRVADVIRYRFEPPLPDAASDLHRYMATVFADTLRDVLKAHGVVNVENNIEEAPAELLVGVRGRLFTVNDDFHVGESVHRFAAVGCGSDLAMGALYALGTRGTPRERLTKALHAAEAFSAGVRAPFRFATLTRDRAA
jgi:ATP-dependent protease HslVU (ClpYQ) peptidase subunit